MDSTSKKCDIVHEEHLNAWDLVVLHDGKHISFVGGAQSLHSVAKLAVPLKRKGK